MFARLSRSWSLVKASASVLNQDKELLVFPMVSMGALSLVVLAFALPIFGLGVLDGMTGGQDGRVEIVGYVVAFLFYFSQYLVIFYFNTALVGAAMIRLDGGNPTLGDGLRIANSRFGTIVGYALISATVGVILRAIQERVGFVGKIIVGCSEWVGRSPPTWSCRCSRRRRSAPWTRSRRAPLCCARPGARTSSARRVWDSPSA